MNTNLKKKNRRISGFIILKLSSEATSKSATNFATNFFQTSKDHRGKNQNTGEKKAPEIGAFSHDRGWDTWIRTKIHGFKVRFFFE